MFYGQKPDLRNLIPIFTVTWVNRPTSNKFESHSLKCIIVDRDSRSNGLLYYHPPTKTTFVDGNEYRFDFNSTAGPSFGINYDAPSPSHQRPVSTPFFIDQPSSVKINKFSSHLPTMPKSTSLLSLSKSPLILQPTLTPSGTITATYPRFLPH